MALPVSSIRIPASPSNPVGWNLGLTYATLPPLFHTAVKPTPVRAPELEVLNRPLAESLGLVADALMGDEGAAILAGNALPPGAFPLAQAYAGHQYGHFTGLGDGRAILLGEQVTPRGERFDIQWKGSGPTPYSRRGDGRAAIGPMLREYLISEAMHALGIPTTRSLAVASTGEKVWREAGELRGAVLTRVAASHIRVGTFQWAAAAGGEDASRALVDYTVQRHFPELAASDHRARALLEVVTERQASLIARWMLVGFVHGVMNTDNMAISGETIDYGPCAFIDTYDPASVFSSIDRHGRYAYGNQPVIAQWNLARLAESLLLLLDPMEDRAIAMGSEIVEGFTARYHHHWLSGMRRKLGLFNEEPEDAALVAELLEWMQRTQADFTRTFASLSAPRAESDPVVADPEFARWQQRWRARLGRQSQASAESLILRRAHNPAFVPRNHLVESALAAADQRDLGVLERLQAVLATPFDHARHAPEYAKSAPDSAGLYKTFCGT